jgi:N-acetylglucosaminyldiphosphoundecaprenol N-acetyl-beta-D-mannosaminyltransferase
MSPDPRPPGGDWLVRNMNISSRAETSSSMLRSVRPDDLSRRVFGVLGIPLDALDLATLLRTLQAAIYTQAPFLLSTPNVNFLILSRSDKVFHESLLTSDLCPVDGMPLIWIARLLGIPIKGRLSGSDIFDALRSREQTGQRFNVFLFGGRENIAEIVSKNLNLEADGMRCVGALNPGFGTIEDMSTDRILQSINVSDADLLTVFLSARKAQGWLLRNHDRLQVPVRAQFGATVNVQAGVVKRAPTFLRNSGLEWLWRIKEEPYLWRRYGTDGGKLLVLLLTRVTPLSIVLFWRRIIGSAKKGQLVIDVSEHQKTIRVKVSGEAVERHVDLAISRFRRALDQAFDAEKDVLVDVADASFIDPRFFGLFLMVRKQLISKGRYLVFQGMTPRMKRLFRLNGFEFLLDSKHSSLTNASFNLPAEYQK